MRYGGILGWKREEKERISVLSGRPRRRFAAKCIVFGRNANRKSITADVVRANNFALKLDSAGKCNRWRGEERWMASGPKKKHVGSWAAFNT